jgi:Fe-S cluster biogenesis protein NfuA
MSTPLELLEGRSGSLRERVETALGRVRPALLADGGDVDLIDVQEGVVLVRLLGACSGCPMAVFTLKAGIEESLRRDVPEIVAVETIG